MHGASNDPKTREDSLKVLNWIYSKIPATKGCLENISKENGCAAWCCEKQNPQVMYSEFLNAWSHVVGNWKAGEFISLVERCIEAYLYDSKRRGCVFWKSDTKLCSIHNHRPFNCRVYGIIPEEEFTPRFKRLKVIYPDTKPQCNLVSTENGKEITKKDLDAWWKMIINTEKALGVPAQNVHDGDGGSYRTFYEHVILETMGVDGMIMLSDVREAGSDSEKSAVIEVALNGLRKVFDAKN